MKTHGKSKVNLNFSISFTLWQLYIQKNNPHYTLNTSCDGPNIWPGHCGEKDSCCCSESNHDSLVSKRSLATLNNQIKHVGFIYFVCSTLKVTLHLSPATTKGSDLFQTQILIDRKWLQYFLLSAFSLDYLLFQK